MTFNWFGIHSSCISYLKDKDDIVNRGQSDFVIIPVEAPMTEKSQNESN